MADTDSNTYDPKVDRLRILNAIYDELKDDTMSSVSLWDIKDALGMSDERAANAVNYLADEHLIKPLRTFASQLTPISTQITHYGVKAMEAAKEQPAQSAASGLAPYQIVNNITINSTGSSGFQIGTVASTQTNQISNVGGGDGGELRRLIAEIESKMPQLRPALGDEAAADLESDAEMVKAQIDLPKPKNHVIRACLDSMKTILEGAGGNLVASGIADLIGNIHL